jgi:hypothetical protein
MLAPSPVACGGAKLDTGATAAGSWLLALVLPLAGARAAAASAAAAAGADASGAPVGCLRAPRFHMPHARCPLPPPLPVAGALPAPAAALLPPLPALLVPPRWLGGDAEGWDACDDTRTPLP